MQQPGGTWSEIDVLDVLHRAGVTGAYWPGNAAVGPLGVAVVMTEARDGDDAHRYLVTTTDGNDVSVIDLGNLLAGGYPAEVRVTADAITVAVQSGGEHPTTKLLVGTPPR
jgi:DNA-binding beta-propeller fold protein YncE